MKNFMYFVPLFLVVILVVRYNNAGLGDYLKNISMSELAFAVLPLLFIVLGFLLKIQISNRAARFMNISLFILILNYLVPVIARPNPSGFTFIYSMLLIPIALIFAGLAFFNLFRKEEQK